MIVKDIHKINALHDCAASARDYAVSMHNNVNHFYDGHPYWVHLDLVVMYAYKYIHIIDVAWRPIVITACYCHDLIEDCRLTYNDLKSVFNVHVADIVYAVTNEKGKTRKERANEKYYQGIKNTKYAAFVKVCDRLANIEYSTEKQSGKFQMYKKEYPEFKTLLYSDDLKTMFDELDSFFL